MNIGDFVFTLEGWQAVLTIFAPLVVGLLTGLTTSSKVKAVISLVLITLTAVVQAVLTGGWTNDVFANILALVVIWQGCYQFWKALGLTTVLQKSGLQLFAK